MIWFCQWAGVLWYPEAIAAQGSSPGGQVLNISHPGPHPLLAAPHGAISLDKSPLWHGHDVLCSCSAQV